MSPCSSGARVCEMENLQEILGAGAIELPTNQTTQDAIGLQSCQANNYITHDIISDVSVP